MTRLPADLSLVYLYCRNILSSGEPRRAVQQLQLKLILEEFRRPESPRLKALTQEYPLDSLYESARTLLKNGVFGDLQRAKKHFPELFRLPKAGETVATASEIETLCKEAEVRDRHTDLPEEDKNEKHILEEDENFRVCPADGITIHDGVRVQQVSPTNDQGFLSKKLKILLSTAGSPPTTGILWSEPIFLSFGTQHWVLTTLQALLEASCFDFAQKWLPDLITSKGWDCPEAAELHLWTEALFEKSESMPASALSSTNDELWALMLVPVPKIRH